MFNVGDKIIRARGAQGHTLRMCPIGSTETVKSVLSDGELIDCRDSYHHYLKSKDFDLVTGENKVSNVSEAVVVLRDKLATLKKQPKSKDLIKQTEQVIKDLTDLHEAIEVELPYLTAFAEDLNTLFKEGEFSLAQVKSLIDKAKITRIDGQIIRADGSTEDLELNYRGALRPPIDTFKDGDTFNIAAIDIELNSEPDVPFSSGQILALLRNGF